MSIEQNYSIRFIASLGLREKQIQQNSRPIIAAHKWFARRPGTLFRGLRLSEFGNRAVEETYYRANRFDGVTIADTFMGGGTPLLEANRIGCNVIGTDIRPETTRPCAAHTTSPRILASQIPFSLRPPQGLDFRRIIQP
jgi:hypothetical protein